MEFISFQFRRFLSAIAIIISFILALVFTFSTLGALVSSKTGWIMAIPCLIISICSWKCCAYYCKELGKTSNKNNMGQVYTQKAMEIQDLEILRKNGALTDGEFNIAKSDILSKNK